MHTERSEPALENRLRAERMRQGLSQQQLAANAGVTRQTISGLEAGHYSPSAAVALKLARVLRCRVEDLFWLEEGEQSLLADSAALSAPMPGGTERRVALAKVGARYVLHGLHGDAAFHEELIPADGIAAMDSAEKRWRVRLLSQRERVERTAVVAGCAPALTLWARSASDWRPGLRTLALHANSHDALSALCRGEVHIAGLHLHDEKTGESNTPFVRAAFASDAARSGGILLIQLGVWEEGLLLAPSNPKGIRRAEDLAGRADIRLVNREPGSGGRQLLDDWLDSAHLPATSVPGYNDEVTGHAAVARAIASGAADAGISTASLATIYGLDFIPLRAVRYDLAVRRDYLDHEPVRELLATLDHGWVKQQLRVSGGFDTQGTGEVSADISG